MTLDFNRLRLRQINCGHGNDNDDGGDGFDAAWDSACKNKDGRYQEMVLVGGGDQERR
jgi:hypothetical protein